VKYRKKPVEIEAVLVRDLVAAARGNWAGLPVWAVDAYEAGKLLFLPDAVLVVTLEGEMRGDLDDMLILGTRGELYPCKWGPFTDSYEPV
jgi:hypothetical protein